MGVIFLLILWLVPSHSLVAFDCSTKTTDVAKISLLGTEDCELPSEKVVNDVVKIQVIQKPTSLSVHAYACFIHLQRTAYYCGAYSHIAPFKDGHNTYMIEINHEDCQKIHSDGTYRHRDRLVLETMHPNSSRTLTRTLAGSATTDATCSGSYFDDGYISVDNAYVQGIYTITIQDYEIPVLTEDNLVILPSGVRCNYKKGHCIDIEDGDVYWNTIDPPSCRIMQGFELFSGYANKTYSMMNGERNYNDVIYTVNTGGKLFSFPIYKNESHCGLTFSQPDHPRLLIIEFQGRMPPFELTSINSQNVDLMLYVNSKFVFLDNHLDREMTRLYDTIRIAKCNLERSILKNQLSTAFIDPNVFAYMYNEEPGYTSVVAGEVVYIMRCTPVNVTHRETTSCYNELPVEVNGRQVFMTPRNHIIVNRAQQITCSSLLAPVYQLSSHWYASTTQLMRTSDISVMKATSDLEWKYSRVKELMSSGVYGEKALQDAQERIMYGTERVAIESIMHRRMLGYKSEDQGLPLSTMFSERDKLTFGTWSFRHVFGWISVFGDYISGFIGVVVALKAIVYVGSVVIRVLSLRNVLGWSWRLLGAVWGSLTQYYLTRAYRERGSAETPSEVVVSGKSEEDTPMKPLMHNPYPELSHVTYPSLN